MDFCLFGAFYIGIPICRLQLVGREEVRQMPAPTLSTIQQKCCIDLLIRHKLHPKKRYKTAKRLLQALASNFPSKMCDLDAYLLSYGHFRRF